MARLCAELAGSGLWSMWLACAVVLAVVHLLQWHAGKASRKTPVGGYDVEAVEDVGTLR